MTFTLINRMHHTGYAARDLTVSGSVIPLHASVSRLTGHRLDNMNKTRKGVNLTPMAYYLNYTAPGRDEYQVGWHWFN
jgi:hypothetical protein